MLQDASATEALGGLLAKEISDRPGSWLIMLKGSLGTGKSTLARGFLRALGYEGRVPSPTYTLLEPYDIGGRSVLHADLYRLTNPEELEYLGFQDAFSNDTVALIEWPERAGSALRTPDLTIELEISATGRKAMVTAQSERGQDLLEALLT
ncbi:MAG: tRNA (adenosine(37)-N6)-threonylcarbamoyltransferase complex ATPase subunit type 1 TsaE [Gammaproteobacteria bacterium]|nr:MAG: tRNA (adenosine(37)-N6)-threonylcarbamoyltransferase complex ATPase subunit type 1 TsaE [Gammaproteobacteria bacterium]